MKQSVWIPQASKGLPTFGRGLHTFEGGLHTFAGNHLSNLRSAFGSKCNNPQAVADGVLEGFWSKGDRLTTSETRDIIL